MDGKLSPDWGNVVLQRHRGRRYSRRYSDRQRSRATTAPGQPARRTACNAAQVRRAVGVPAAAKLRRNFDQSSSTST